MGAISVAVLSLMEQGTHLVAQTNHHGATLSLLRDLLPRFGVQVTQADQRDTGAFEKWRCGLGLYLANEQCWRAHENPNRRYWSTGRTDCCPTPGGRIARLAGDPERRVGSEAEGIRATGDWRGRRSVGRDRGGRPRRRVS